MTRYSLDNQLKTINSEGLNKIRGLAVLAIIAWNLVIPFAKAGITGAAVLFVLIGLPVTTWLLLKWERLAADGLKASYRSRVLWLLLVFFTGLLLFGIYAAFFEAPIQITRGYRYIVEKLFFVANLVQIKVGLNQLMPLHLWWLAVEVLFCVVLLLSVVWLIRLKLNFCYLVLFFGLIAAGLFLNLLAPSPEFQITNTGKGAQFASQIAADANGNFIKVWQSRDQDGSGWGIFARRFNADGIPQGDEFQVNSFTANDQFVPRVALDNSGNFAIVWESDGQDGSSFGIFCQRFDAAGVRQGNNFQVNTTSINSQHDPFIAMTPGGAFVVVWVSDGQDGNLAGIFGRLYDAAGNPQSGEFQINSYTVGDQKQPSVASDANGNFTVVWDSAGQDGSGKGIFIRRYNATGIPQSDDVQVNNFTANDQSDSWINMNPNGDFVVVWCSAGQDHSGSGIYARRYNAAGVPQGDEFRVNTYTKNDQIYPTAAIGPNGDFVIVWESDGQDGSGKGVYGQRYNANGNPKGGEFQINIYTTNHQFNAVVTGYPNGNFIVAWISFGQDGSVEGVYGRRFASSGRFFAERFSD